MTRLAVPVRLALLVGFAAPAAAQDAPSVRSAAVVDLSFDETDGPAEDRATAGAGKDAGTPVNGPVRVTSPFRSGGGKALRLDAGRNQYVRIDDAADTDRPAGSSLSLCFLNLHPPGDAAFHGIVNKRLRTEDGSRTNYGINFMAAQDKLQIYLHDGSGFRVAMFPLGEAVGSRRPVHLTTTFRHGTAPGSPEGSTDVEVRLYANGKPVAPKPADGTRLEGPASWITGVKAEGLLNDAPLTIGSSFAESETTSGLVDDFLLFDRPLTADEAGRLFAEVAGADAARFTGDAPATTGSPELTDMVPRGATVGATTKLTLTGRRLGPDAVVLVEDAAATPRVLPESTPEKLVVELDVPAETSPAVVRLFVRTSGGLSEPLPLPIDRLPQRLIGEAASDDPAALPAAFTGRLAGSERPRVVFEGKAGRTFVAEVEARRLGGGADPVLELKTAAGTPVDIAWGGSARGGDPRLVTRLPADGRYVLELHDLAYKAPATPFRLLVGELTLIDAVFPPRADGDVRAAHAVGVNVADPAAELRTGADRTGSVTGPAAATAHGALPVVLASDGREYVEDQIASPVDVAAGGPAYVSGRLAAPAEADRYEFSVRPGTRLRIEVDSAPLGSAFSPVVTVTEDGKQLARKAAEPGADGASVEVSPSHPGGRITVEVADRLRGSKGERLYRVAVVPADRPTFTVTATAPSLSLPRAGRTLLTVRLDRPMTTGEVRLLSADGSLIVEPATLPAGDKPVERFVTVRAAGADLPRLASLAAEVDGPSGVVRVPVRFTPGASVAAFDARRPYSTVPVAEAVAAAEAVIAALPAAAFKGTTAPVRLTLAGPRPDGHVFRLSLVTDEPTRPNDPKDPAKGDKPLVRFADDFAVSETEAGAPLVTPADVAAGEIEAAVKVEVVPHAWSDRVASVGYSAPFRLAVKEAVAAVEPAAEVTVRPGENAVAGAVRRTEGFDQSVRVELRGLPNGFTATPVDAASDVAEFSLKLAVPQDAPAGPVKDAELVVLSTDGSVLKSVKPFPIKVEKP